MSIRSLALSLLILLPVPAAAIDPGVASGRYSDDGVELSVSHAIALRQDNDEGLLTDGPEMRVVVSDVEVLPEALHGVAFLPVETMAREGKVRGLLFRFDPADRKALRVTILAKPADPATSFATVTMTDSEGVWRKLLASDTRVLGTLDRETLAVDFSAPVFNDRVTADLKGPAARNNEFVALLVARAQALGRGDVAGFKRMSTRRSAARLDALPPEYLSAMRGQAGAMAAEYGKITRIVVRSDTAIALLPDRSWVSFTHEDGAWKVE